MRSSEIPEVKQDDGVNVKIIAGEFEGVKGAVTEIYADPEYLDVTIPASGFFETPIKLGYTVFAYVFEGEGIFGNFKLNSMDKVNSVSATRLLIFSDGDIVRAYARDHVRFLLVSGKALNEPIARYGPFVMNTSEEIEQALKDLNHGTFVK